MSSDVRLWVIAFVAAVIGGVICGLVFASLRAFAAWRAFRSLRRHVTDGLLEAARRLERAEERFAGAGKAAARLDRARREFQEAIQTASVLSAAAGEVRAVLTRARDIVPRK